MKRQNDSATKKEKIISTIISIGIIMALVFGVYSVATSVKKGNDKNNIVNLNETEENVAIKTEDGNLDENDAYDELHEVEAADSGAVDNTATTRQEETTFIEETTVSAEEAAAAALTGYPFSEGNLMGWPVTGDIAMKYSMDTTIFYKTLGQYKCSPAIMISSAVGTEVKAAAPGVVESVENLKETGITMTISMGNGYKAVYGMLNEVSLASGDAVNGGDTIGTVGMQSAYYKEEGPGLYFQVLKNGEPVDPMSYLEQEEE
ncbi:MAG: M23 family metallopeptidase [Eubacteriales bacterium]|nr:M23 family metallopeptidase [Eubacteriales bacterium]